MAAVYVPPSPQMSLNIATRRHPLANVPNATNSPHRTATVVPAKRRSTSTQTEIPFAHPPPKKHIVDPQEHDGRSSARTRTDIGATDPKLFTKRSTNSHQNAFEKKLVAARDKDRQTQQKGARQEKLSTETLENIRQWQKHYRKAFPHFVFYFDSVSADIRNRCSRQVTALGAREEKFFSRLVTHVVTGRLIPPETNSNTNSHNVKFSQGSFSSTVQTVNPSLLERTAESSSIISYKPDGRREPGTLDVLCRAREMGMKIWAVDKLQRMIATINDSDISSHSYINKSNNATAGVAKAKGETELSQVLKNDRLNGHSDREALFSSKDMVIFRGSFIYLHDMDERTRPVIVREYPKVAKRTDGAWPQFRSAPIGKCPFIEDPPAKEAEIRHPVKQQGQGQQQLKRLEPGYATVGTKLRPEQKEKTEILKPPTKVKENTMADAEEESTSGMDHVQPKQKEVVQAPSAKRTSPKKSSESFVAPQIPHKKFSNACLEPVASGVQPSNITSAIRSQMISSTAAAPGAKAGVSKEVHELKRKVLEKSNGGVSTGAKPITGATASANNPKDPGPPRKAIGHEKVALTNGRSAVQFQTSGNPKPRGASLNAGFVSKLNIKRNPKPGYCENCRDKFDDFDEHIISRKHRKFATNTANWVELDDLLNELGRRPKYSVMEANCYEDDDLHVSEGLETTP